GSLVEQATRECDAAVLLESRDISDVDLRSLGDLAQGDLTQFALTLESLAEARHRHRARRATTCWARKTFDRGLIIRTGCGFVKPAQVSIRQRLNLAKPGCRGVTPSLPAPRWSGAPRP